VVLEILVYLEICPLQRVGSPRREGRNGARRGAGERETRTEEGGGKRGGGGGGGLQFTKECNRDRHE